MTDRRPHLSLATILAATALCTTAASLRAQVQWKEIVTANKPSPRSRAGAAYDAARDRFVLFGGTFSTTSGPNQTYSDTWLFDGTDWTNANPKTTPPDRKAPGMCFDSWRQRVVMFGGYSFPNGTSRGDTWEWDGTDWTQRSPTNSPSPRSFVNLAFDPQRGRAVMFGGRLASGYSDETWEWDGNTWTLAQPTRRPPPAGHAVLFYDDVSRRTIMAGGWHFNGRQVTRRVGTWAWDGKDWTQLNPAFDYQGEFDDTAVFDPARGRAVRYQGFVGGVIEWDGATWTKRVPAPPLPTLHYGMNLVYDSRRARVLGFGGHPSVGGPGPYFDETWSYTPTNPATVTAYGRGCAGTAGVPQLTCTLPWIGEPASMKLRSLPASATAWFILGLSDKTSVFGSLPASLAPIGMPGCSLFASTDLVLAVSSQGSTAGVSLPVPYDPRLLGFRYYVQGAVIDPGANALGVAVSDAAAAVIGGK